MAVADEQAARSIERWLLREARQSGDAAAVVTGFCERLDAAGLRLVRVRLGQQLKSPLLAAWGVLWTREGGAELYVFERQTLATDAYQGSPFQIVREQQRPVRRRLAGLDPARDHAVYREAAAQGGTDYLALPVTYGDGSRQGWSFVTDAPDGFGARDLALLERLIDPLAAALEPIAVRRSMESLLTAYLGRGPAAQVIGGSFRRGEQHAMDAAIVLTDLRGFTRRSESEPIPVVLDALGRYFDAVVSAIEAEGGDVLKFMGDGVLAVLPVDGGRTAPEAARAALGAVARARADLARAAPGQAFTAVLHVGAVAYGNIGSPDRLDFTIIGAAVNRASRLERLAKRLDEPVLASGDFVRRGRVAATPLGAHAVDGVEAPLEVFRPALP